MRTEWKLYQASEWETGKRTFYPLLDPDADRNIDQWTLLKLRSDARKVFVNYGPLKTAVHEKARYAVGDGWLPQYIGEDKDFGKAARDWLTKIWYYTGNVAGRKRDWWESLKVESRYLDIYGEIFIYKVRDKGGFPRYQHIAPHRIDNPRQNGQVDNDGYLTTGKYKGYKCLYGIISDDYGATVAYCVRAAKPEKDKIVPADQMIHCGDWEFVDQTRPISAIAHGILNCRDIISTQANEKRAIEIASSISVLENNPLGGVDINDPTQYIRAYSGVVASDEGTPPTPPGFQTEQPVRAYKWTDNGEYKYFKSDSGSDVKAFQFQRPAGEIKDFWDRLGRDAINFVWPFDLISNPTGGSANNRTLWVRANGLTRDRQSKLYGPAKQRLLFALATAVDLKILPESEDWMEWDFSFPRKPSIDAGRDAQQDREDIKMGVKSWSDIHEELGTTTEVQAFRKAMDLVQMFSAKRAAEQAYEIMTGQAITLPDDYMFLLTPNGTAGQPGSEPGPQTEPEPVPPDKDTTEQEEAEETDKGGDEE
jgi:Bacteriophage capsid protein